jgi:hypothetical protein
MSTEQIMDCETGEVTTIVLDQLSLPARREQLAQAVRARRWQAETGGILVGGAPIRTDDGSQAKIGGAVALFDNDPTLAAIDWEAQPGVWVTLDEQTMRAIGVAVGRHVQACFSRARTLIEAIAGASDLAALEAIDIDSGWPG